MSRTQIPEELAVLDRPVELFSGKKVLIILGSSRAESSTRKTVLDFLKEAQVPMSGPDVRPDLGAENSPVSMDWIDLRDFRIGQYDYEPEKNKGDDFLMIAEKLVASDVVVFATPIYWYSMSGLMKVFFDRLTELITIRKKMGRALHSKEVYLVACGGNAQLPEGFEVPFQMTSEYLDMVFKGSFYQQRRDP